MKKFELAVATAVAFAALSGVNCAAQDQGRMTMSHGGPRLFVAQADGDKVVPRSGSSATATGAFMIDAETRSVSYDLTFHGLEHGPAKSIALYNFGSGGNGAVVNVICGGDSRACPAAPSANLTGSWQGEGRVRLDGKLLGEFASARVYVQIIGGDGKPEIRGQLEPNGAMVPVRNYVAHLAPAPGVDSKGTGTAVYSEAHFADGRVAVFYQVTVAGTKGAPQDVQLAGVPANVKVEMKSLRRNALPKSRLLNSRAAQTGGTMTGEYEVGQKESNALVATSVLATGSHEVGIVVTTTGFPEGELYGAFKPVN